MGLLSDLAGSPRTGTVPVRGKSVTVHALSNGAFAELVEAHAALKPIIHDLDMKALVRCPRSAVAALLAAALDTTETDVTAAKLSAAEEWEVVRVLLEVSFSVPDLTPGEPEGPDAAAPAAENAPGRSSSAGADASASTPSP